MSDYKKIANDVKLGKNVIIFQFTNLYGCTIGDNTKIGAFVEIQKNVNIGDNCKISSHSFICEGVEIKNNVFIGHSVKFTNDKYPRATANGKLQTEDDWKVEKTYIEEGVSIGTGSVILSNITIGKNSVIGAGSVVTKDIPANVIAFGNPCKIVRKIEDEKI